MALFTDFGHVAAKPSDLSLSDLKHGYGIGFRLKTAQAVFFRFDIGVGAGEGTQYVIKYSRAF
jgi:outer membrane translocation and assembly module TamA